MPGPEPTHGTRTAAVGILSTPKIAARHRTVAKLSPALPNHLVQAELQASELAGEIAGQGLPAGSEGPPARISQLRGLLEARVDARLPPLSLRTDSAAADRAHRLRARAYTEGREIGFGQGAFQPGTPAGDRLVVHELAHVWQQNVVASVPISVQRDAEPGTATTNVYYKQLTDAISQLFDRVADPATDSDTRARLEREAVVLINAAPNPVTSEADVTTTQQRAREVSPSEDDTVAYLTKAGLPVQQIQFKHPIGFPSYWSKLVYDALDAHIDVAELRRQRSERFAALTKWADGLPEVILKQGLPLSYERAISRHKISFGLELTVSKLAPDHPVIAFARACGGYAGLSAGASYLGAWQLMAASIRDDIANGAHVVDPAAYKNFVDNQQKILADLPQRIREVGLTGPELNELEKTMIDLSNVQLVRSWVSFLVGLGTIFQSWGECGRVFDGELDKVDTALAKLKDGDRIGTAILWAYHCGYLARAAKAELAELLEEAPSLIASSLVGIILGFILIQFIPGIDLLFDAIVVITSGIGAIEAADAIYEALKEAAAADNVVDMQRASARMADVLVGDGLKLIKDLVMLVVSARGIKAKMGKFEAAGATREDALRRAFEEETGPVKGKKLGAGPKEPAGPGYVRKPPTQAELDLVAEMQQQRITRGLAKIKTGPLRAFLEAAPASLQELAADSPDMMEELWTAFQDRMRDPEFKTREFGRYVRIRMRASRGRLGEFMEGFLRGPDEVMAYAPKDVTTQAGLDMITYTNEKRVNIIDNKAFRARARVGEVSAFEENLPQNLQSVIDEMEGYVGGKGVPPELKSEVLPKLKAAQRDVAAEYAKELASNPKADLYATSFQKRISAVLDRHGVDRIVTLSGSGEQVKVSAALLDRLTP